MKTTSREEALEAALTDERILAAATKEFPRWREDIQEQFVLRVVRAALAALPDERSREFLDWWHERGRYILEASSDECEIVWRAALAQPVQPAPEPRIAAQVYVGTNGAQVCPMTHGLGDWLASLRPGIHDLVLRRQP